MIVENGPSSTLPEAPPEPAVVPQADFLFHLYRGSELLDDNRLLEAQSELEYALTLEPTDLRTRGLLGAVYFRSGFYARAIATYRALLEERAGDATLRRNLALSYLKTGESDLARVELEALLLDDASDIRAWGYLALALDRLGYVDQAREAFERAGQPDLARRMVEQRGAAKPRAGRSVVPGPSDGSEGAVRSSQRGFPALDSGELRLELGRAEPSFAEAHSARARVAPPLEGPARPRYDTLAWGSHTGAAPAPARVWGEPPTLSNYVEDARVHRLGEPPGIVVLGTQLARIDLMSGHPSPGFAFRLDALRTYDGAIHTEILPRRTREDLTNPHESPGETFGGIGTPFAATKGPARVVVGARVGQRIHAFTLEGEVVFVRESAVLGFDLTLEYENGRFGATGSVDVVPIVQLHGAGALLLEQPSDLHALDVRAGGLTVRKDIVVGWVGRLLPTALAAADAPCGQRGLVAFSGEGTVLVSAK